MQTSFSHGSGLSKSCDANPTPGSMRQTFHHGAFAHPSASRPTGLDGEAGPEQGDIGKISVSARLHIGILCADTSAVSMEMLDGVLDEAGNGRASVAIRRVRCDGAEVRAALRDFAEVGVAGVVLDPPLSEMPALSKLRIRGMRFAVVASGSAHPHAIGVQADDRAAGRAMARHLLELGHRRIGIITGGPGRNVADERLAGAREAIEGIVGAELMWEPGATTHASGKTAAHRLLDNPHPPTAIFATDDHMAVGVLAVAAERGIAIPADLTVVGFGDTYLATAIWPELTTIRQPFRAMAAEAARRLLLAMTSDVLGDPARICDHSWIVRKSSTRPGAFG